MCWIINYLFQQQKLCVAASGRHAMLLLLPVQLASKVFKKVHSKYADVTEQQVSELLQQLLQGDR